MGVIAPSSLGCFEVYELRTMVLSTIRIRVCAITSFGLEIFVTSEILSKRGKAGNVVVQRKGLRKRHHPNK